MTENEDYSVTVFLVSIGDVRPPSDYFLLPYVNSTGNNSLVSLAGDE